MPIYLLIHNGLAPSLFFNIRYREMLKEIESKVQQEMKERESRVDELKKIMNEKRAEATKAFEDTYVVALEDLAAKDGTGKKYGKPKRIAQVSSN